MRFTWSERKRASNVKDHRLDFVDAPRVFEQQTFTYQDDRFAYGEQRFLTLGDSSPGFLCRWHIRSPTMKSGSSPSARQRSVKPRSTSVKSKTDWAYLQQAAAKGKPTKEHPEADVAHIVRGIARRGLEPLPSKTLVSLRVDQDVLAWFKAQGPGYQTRINSVLRAFRDASA